MPTRLVRRILSLRKSSTESKNMQAFNARGHHSSAESSQASFLDVSMLRSRPDAFARFFHDLSQRSHQWLLEDLKDQASTSTSPVKQLPLPHNYWQRFWMRGMLNELFDVAKSITRDFPGTQAQIKYEPLKSAKGIRICSFADSDSIICTFREIDYDSDDPNNQYTALSYPWGSDEDPQQIVCNGVTVSVSKNLYLAMQALREHRPGWNYWIDKICINQDDLDEKARQVQLMRDIYGSARVTAIWLSEGWEGHEHAREAIQQLGEASHAGRRAAIQGDYGPHDNLNDLMATLDLPGEGSVSLREFDKLLASEWFTRAWCYQEVVLSETAYMLCGDMVIMWLDFYWACLSVDYFGLRRAITNNTNLGAAISMGTVHEKIHHLPDPAYQGKSLLYQMIVGRNRGTSDPRDKIFAYLGIAPEGKDKSVIPDYHLSVEDVYRQAAVGLLTRNPHKDFDSACPSGGSSDIDEGGDDPVVDHAETSVPRDASKERIEPDSSGNEVKDGSEQQCPLPKGDYGPTTTHLSIHPISVLDLLSAAYGMNTDSCLPTWVPDWRKPRRQFLPERNCNGTARFFAGGLREASVVTSKRDQNVIGVAGVVFDEITDVTSPCKSRLDDPRKAIPESMWEVIYKDGEWAKLARSIAPDNIYAKTGENIDVAFFTVCVGGFTPWSDYFDSDAKLTHWPVAMALATRKLSDADTDDIGFRTERMTMVLSFCLHQRLAITERGYLALVPEEAEKGDKICILLGASVPHVLRPSLEGGSFQFVGDSYVHGLMRGEALQISCGVDPLKARVNDSDHDMSDEEQEAEIAKREAALVCLCLDVDQLEKYMAVERLWLR